MKYENDDMCNNVVVQKTVVEAQNLVTEKVRFIHMTKLMFLNVVFVLVPNKASKR